VWDPQITHDGAYSYHRVGRDQQMYALSVRGPTLPSWPRSLCPNMGKLLSACWGVASLWAAGWQGSGSAGCDAVGRVLHDVSEGRNSSSGSSRPSCCTARGEVPPATCVPYSWAGANQKACLGSHNSTSRGPFSYGFQLPRVRECVISLAGWWV